MAILLAFYRVTARQIDFFDLAPCNDGWRKASPVPWKFIWCSIAFFQNQIRYLELSTLTPNLLLLPPRPHRHRPRTRRPRPERGCRHLLRQSLLCLSPGAPRS